VSSSGRFTFRDAKVRAAAGRDRRVLDRRQRPPGHRPRRPPGGRLSRVALAHVRRGTRQAAFYLERCKTHGRAPKAVAIRRDIYVGESAADAEAVKAQVLAAGYRGIPAPALVAGSVDQVVERFAELATLGYTDVIVDTSPAIIRASGFSLALRRVREALASV
jgi:hypothetical protein